MNRIDMGYKHYREFAENLLQVKLNHLIYQEAPLGETKWAKEELDRRMQTIFDKMYYYGFKPTCDLVQEEQKNT